MAYTVLEDLYGSLELVLFPRVLEACRTTLKAGRVVIVQGKLNAREDEAPKLLVTSVEVAPAPESLPEENKVPKKTNASSAPAGLYLKLPTLESEQWIKAKKLLRVFEGNLPVYLRLAESGKLVRVPRDLWVSPEPVLLSELERLLGRENVAKV